MISKRISAALLTSLVVVGSSGSAMAADSKVSATKESSAASAVSLSDQELEVAMARQAMADMGSDYTSLSASMAKNFAASGTRGKEEYLVASKNLLSSLGLSGGGSPMPQALNGVDVSSMSVGELNQALVSSGAGVDFKGFSNLSSAITSMRQNSTSIDATVTAAGALWGAQMLSLKVPSLKTPEVPKVSSSYATRMPAEGLAFGMFMNRSINKMLSNFPDVFKEVTGTGVRGKKSKAAWKESVRAAARSSRSTFENVVPGACGKDFVSGLAGEAQTGGCTPCSVSGLYAHSQLVAAGPLAIPDFSGYSTRSSQSGTVSDALSSVGENSVCQSLGPEIQQTASEAAAKVVRSLK